MRLNKSAYQFEIFRFALLAILVIIFLYPFVFMVLKSLDEMANFGLTMPPTLIPEKFGFHNYISTLKAVKIGKYYLNTMYVAGWVVVLHLFTAVLGGYAISKGKFRGKAIWLLVILSTMMIPSEAILLNRFLMFKNWNLANTYTGLVLPALSYPFGVFLNKQYFDSLPNYLGEAAKIDGANEWQIMTRVYLPLTGPILATITILTVIHQWNTLLWPLLMLTKSDMFTVPLGLAFFSLGEMNKPILGNSLAIATFAVLPVIVMFLILQKYIIQSIASSGTKE